MDAIERAKRGDLKFLKEAPVEILLNARDSNDATVLSMVVYDNRLDCCEVICERCPSLLYHNPRHGRNTPLHSAAYSGNLDILKLLISACDKADQEGDRAGKQKTLTLRTTSYGYNVMHKAIFGRQPESIKLLIEADPNNELLRAGDRKNNTPLHLAVGLKSEHEIARLLIEADPDYPYRANSDGKTPLLIAIDKAEWQKDREMLNLILELQPTQSMVSVNERGWTALHYSVYKKKLDTTGYIIQSCPDSSKVADNEGRNFFHHAVKSGNVNMVKHILGMKEITSTVLNSPDNLGRTPFDVAAVSRNESMILCLHEDPRVNKKLTVTKNLNWIVEKHNFVMMNMFLKTNDDLLMNIELEVFKNSVDEEGDTILFKAAQENHLFLCKELYKRCPSLIYHQSKDGRTALHHAAWKGEPKMLKFLIAAGAKSYNEDAEDDIESGGGEIIRQKMLLTMVDDQDDTALHKAVLNHKLVAVKLLVEADPDYEYVANTSGDTPIMISVREARLNDNKFDSGNHHSTYVKF
ncbi:Ankyrin repeat [Thalictrum thalictroides]|uniref:Ankyrin repeat n=1 Tax=Thalictrum thalictroides TaxID=46969 RepID=A0A7J6X398_THATH|nr:Ankyrin repeat [Thalictrum thalictroides]